MDKQKAITHNGMSEQADVQEAQGTIERLTAANAELKRALAELREETVPVMRDRFLTELLWGVAPQRELSKKTELYGLALGEATYKSVVVFEIETEPRAMPATVPEYIVRIIREQLPRRCKSAVLMETLKIIVITAWDTDDFIGELMGIANRICARCMSALEIKITAGVGRYYNSLDRLHDSFVEAMAALGHRAVVGSGKTIYIDDVHRGGASNIGNLFAAIRFGSREQIHMHIEEFRNELGRFEQWEREARLLGLFGEVYQMVERYELYNEQTVMEALTRHIGGMPEGLGDWFFELCVEMSEHIKSRRERAPHNLSEEAKHYIESHYHESGLSVERLCEHLHVSQSYFSTVFRHETGKSYVQYLTELRMNRAVMLLQQTDEKTYIIASRVGYDDPNYFSYVFKKRFGISPVKYRKEARGL